MSKRFIRVGDLTNYGNKALASGTAFHFRGHGGCTGGRAYT